MTCQPAPDNDKHSINVNIIIYISNNINTIIKASTPLQVKETVPALNISSLPPDNTFRVIVTLLQQIMTALNGIE
jgi:hypothetical protein